MNLDQAREIVKRRVLASKSDCFLDETRTQEFPSCFVFVYQSRKFVESGDFAEQLVEHGPVLISRVDGNVFETGSAFSVSHYVAAFEACGNPLAVPTDQVKIVGWKPGANKVGGTRLIKEKSGMGLAQSKLVIDKTLATEEALFTAQTVGLAEQAVAELKEIGFDAVQLWSNQCQPRLAGEPVRAR